MEETTQVEEPMVVDASEASRVVVVRFPSFIVDISERNGVLYFRQRINRQSVYGELERRVENIQRVIENEFGVTVSDEAISN